MLALPRAQINSIACCGNNDRQPDDPTSHSSPPRKWQRTMAPKKETTPTAAPHGLSPNTLTAILATVQLKRKSASFDIVCLFIPHLSFQDSHFPGMCRGFEFSVTPLLSHSVAARPDFWGQPPEGCCPCLRLFRWQRQNEKLFGISQASMPNFFSKK